MKNYKVKAIINFDDLQENVGRKIGDVFDVGKERYEFLSSHNAVELIGIQKTIDEEIKENVKQESKENATKKSNKKKGK